MRRESSLRHQIVPEEIFTVIIILIISIDPPPYLPCDFLLVIDLIIPKPIKRCRRGRWWKTRWRR